jgi:hypothetical protein
MKVFHATVHIILPADVVDEGMACDAISACLSENLQVSGAILDWGYTDPKFPMQIEVPDEYDEGDYEVALVLLERMEFMEA